jgi:nucleoid-associated protein YgaU
VTRELKLALIVGFALVLVVTVLISDHLSHARQTELAGNIPAEPIKVAEPPTLAMGNDSAPPVAPPSTAPAPATINDPLNLAGTAPTTPTIAPALEPTVITQGSRGTLASSEDTALINDVRRLGGDVRGNTIFVGPAMKTVQDTLPPTTPYSTPPSTTPQPTPARTVIPNPTTTPAVPANPDRVHIVAPGDNVYKIAKEYYGDGKAWRKLAKYNKLNEEAQLKVGEKLSIPTSEALLGKKPTTSVLPITITALPAPINTPAPIGSRNKSGGTAIQLTGNRTISHAAPARSHTYTVKKGDTLAQIAQRELGNARRAREIIELNKNTIKDPDSVPLGAVLTLPA